MAPQLHSETLSRWMQSTDACDVLHAQFIMGWCSYFGLGHVEDKAHAVTWWRRAGDWGHTDAQDWLWHCYRHGFGVPRDLDQAIARA